MEFIVKIGADQTGLNNVLQRMRQTFTAEHPLGGGLLSSLSGLFTVGSVTALSKATVDWAGKLRDVADALGVNVEWLQKMGNGAKLAGGNLEDVGKVINELTRARESAALNPSGKEAKAFSRLGITSSDTTNLSTQDFFDKIVGAFKGGITAQMANDIQEVGGKSARNLLAAFAAQFASDTPVLAEDLIDRLDDIGDAFTDLSTKLKVDVAPGLLWLLDIVVRFVNWVKQWGSFIGGFAGGAGAAIKPNGKMDFFGDLANAVDEGITAGGQAALDEEANQKATEEALQRGRNAARSARRKREKSPPLFSQETIKTLADGESSIARDAKGFSAFQGDTMAQAGLYSGSSLLFNPNLTIQQQQLDVLNQISNNTSKIGEGAFS